MNRALLPFAFAALSVSVAGCEKSLSNARDVAATGVAIFGDRALAVVDDAANRIAVILPTVDGGIVRRYLPLNGDLVALEVSADRSTIFVLTSGVEKTRTTGAIPAELIVVTVEGATAKDAHYTLPSGLTELSLDSEGVYVAVTTKFGSASSSIVVNPSAIALVNLKAPASAQNPLLRSLERNASAARGITFSPELLTPTGLKRFAVGIGPRDVTLIDLVAAFADAAHPDFKIPLTSAGATSTLVPKLLRFDDGDPLSDKDARVAFSLTGESSLLTATLAKNEFPLPGESDLRAVVNLTAMGAPVSDFAFLSTVEGRRIAALTPTLWRAVLADPATSLTTPVPLARPYNELKILAGASTSTVMLSHIQGNTSAVALWDVPKTEDQPYRAVASLVDVRSLEQVMPVPGTASKFMAVSAGGAELVLFDTTTRAVSSVLTNRRAGISLSNDGQRAFIVPRDGDGTFASMNLTNLTSASFNAGADLASLREMHRADGSPVIAVINGTPAQGLSLFDPLHPERLGKRWDDLLVEGIR